MSNSPRPHHWLANKKDDPINSEPTLDIQADTVAVKSFKHFPQRTNLKKTPDSLDFYPALSAFHPDWFFSRVHVNNLKCTVMRSKSVDSAYDARDSTSMLTICNFYTDEALWTQVPLNGLRADRVCLSWPVSIRCILGGVCSGVNCQLMVSWTRGAGTEQITL